MRGTSVSAGAWGKRNQAQQIRSSREELSHGAAKHQARCACRMTEAMATTQSHSALCFLHWGNHVIAISDGLLGRPDLDFKSSEPLGKAVVYRGEYHEKHKPKDSHENRPKKIEDAD